MISTATAVLAELLARPWFRKVAVGALVALAALLAFWRYEWVVSQRDQLATQVEQLEARNATLQLGQKALEEVHQSTKDRTQELNTIKKDINAAPSGDVPADIRAALGGLRDRETRH